MIRMSDCVNRPVRITWRLRDADLGSYWVLAVDGDWTCLKPRGQDPMGPPFWCRLADIDTIELVSGDS